MDALLALVLRTGRIARISLPDGRVEVITDQAGPTPDGVVVEGGVVYWTTMGVPEVDPTKASGEASRDYSRRDGGVHAIGLDGASKRDVVPDGTVTTGKQLTCDGAGTLYWADREGCRVTRVRVDGTGRTDLVVNERGDDGTAECVGVAVDSTRGHLFWTQKGPANGGKGRIFRAGIDIPPGETAANRSDIETLWDGLPEPIDLHLSGNWLYWTDRGAPPRGNTLNRAPIPPVGTQGTPPEVLATGFAEAIGLTTDDEAGLVYVSDLGGEIRMIPIPGGPADGQPPRVVVAFGEPITGLASVPV